MSGLEIFVSCRRFSKRISFGDSGHDLSAFCQIPKNAEVLRAKLTPKVTNFSRTNLERSEAVNTPTTRDNVSSCIPEPPIPANTQMPPGLRTRRRSAKEWL